MVRATLDRARQRRLGQRHQGRRELRRDLAERGRHQRLRRRRDDFEGDVLAAVRSCRRVLDDHRVAAQHLLVAGPVVEDGRLRCRRGREHHRRRDPRREHALIARADGGRHAGGGPWRRRVRLAEADGSNRRRRIGRARAVGQTPRHVSAHQPVVGPRQVENRLHVWRASRADPLTRVRDRIPRNEADRGGRRVVAVERHLPRLEHARVDLVALERARRRVAGEDPRHSTGIPVSARQRTSAAARWAPRRRTCRPSAGAPWSCPRTRSR